MVSFRLFAALPTFFQESGALDLASFQTHVATLAQESVYGFVVGGTTGEGLVLTHTERTALLSALRATALPDQQIYGGVCGTMLEDVVVQAQTWERGGAHGLLVAPAPYLRQNAESLFVYFSAVAQETTLPIMLYNHQKRTNVVLTVPLVQKLRAAFPGRFVSLKDSSGEWAYPGSGLVALDADGFELFAGDDGALGAFFGQGGTGVVSVSGNVVPHLYTEIFTNFQQGRRAEYLNALKKLHGFHVAFDRFSNPLGVKLACEVLGVGTARMRTALARDVHEDLGPLRAALREAGKTVVGV